MKKILVPTDFSECSQNALRHAILMADKIKSSIHLLRIVDPDIAGMELPVMAEVAIKRQIEESETKMKELIDVVLTQLVDRLDGVPVIKSQIEVGKPEKLISHIAEKDSIDLIVMGTHGQHGVLNKIFGSVASDVMSHASGSVLIIPQNVTYNGFKKVTYATDLYEADPYEIWKATQLLQPFSPQIHCVHFQTSVSQQSSRPKMDELKTFFSDRSPNSSIDFHEIHGNNLLDELMEFIQTNTVDLLVMYKPHRNFFERLYHKSLTKQMALIAKVPLLVLK